MVTTTDIKRDSEFPCRDYARSKKPCYKKAEKPLTFFDIQEDKYFWNKSSDKELRKQKHLAKKNVKLTSA